MLKRRIYKVRTETERKILIGMIISTDFINRINDAIDIKFFQMEYSYIVAKWVMDYYKKYREAPGDHIEDIFDLEKENLTEENSQLIGDFLSGLSNEYQRAKKFNVEYFLEEALDYFEERGLLLLSEKISKSVNAGRKEEAKKALREHRSFFKNTSIWVNPFEENFIEEVYHSHLSPESEETETGLNKLFRMPGQLGELMGTFERDWLVSFLAPRKRGKTFFLQEAAVQSAIGGLNTCFISLEMSKSGFGGRLLRRIVAMGRESIYLYPIFDCLKNQKDTCEKRQRKNKVKLLDADGNLPEYSDDMEYRVCSLCRGTKDFKPSVWYEPIKRPVISEKKVKLQAKGFVRTYGDRLRLKAYPAFSANLEQIINDIDILEYTEGFVPDVIVIDYADILAPEDKRMDLHTRTDETWKKLKQLSELKHGLVITATQGNRKSSEKKNVVSNDTSWDISKNDHIDAQFALSQTGQEKKIGMIRVSNTLNRWKEFDENKQVIVLQNLKLSQVVLDSEL